MKSHPHKMINVAVVKKAQATAKPQVKASPKAAVNNTGHGK